jgi:ABC-2 type transport system permease protein
MENKRKHPFLWVMQREWRSIWGKWPYLFMTFVGPLAGFFLVFWLFSANVPRNLPVAIIDLDQTSFSRQVARMVDATPIAKINKDYTSLDEARKSLEKGEVDAILYIPKDVTKDIYKGRNSQVDLYVNNVNVVKSGLLSSGIQKALATISAGIKVQALMQKGLVQQQAITQAMPVSLRPVILFNPYTSYSYYLTFGFLPVMLIVFTLLGSIYAIGTELQYETCKVWLNLANNNILTALAGKLLPYTIMYSVMAMFMNIILFNRLGLPLKGNLAIILTSEFLMIICYQALAIFMVSLSANLRLGLSLGSAYTMMALTFSGLTFPIFGMPAIAQSFAYIFPFTYWLKIFISQSLRGEPAINAIKLLYASIPFIILGLLFVPRLKYILQTKKFWGKI